MAFYRSLDLDQSLHNQRQTRLGCLRSVPSARSYSSHGYVQHIPMNKTFFLLGIVALGIVAVLLIDRPLFISNYCHKFTIDERYEVVVRRLATKDTTDTLVQYAGGIIVQKSAKSIDLEVNGLRNPRIAFEGETAVTIYFPQIEETILCEQKIAGDGNKLEIRFRSVSPANKLHYVDNYMVFVPNGDTTEVVMMQHVELRMLILAPFNDYVQRELDRAVHENGMDLSAGLMMLVEN